MNPLMYMLTPFPDTNWAWLSSKLPSSLRSNVAAIASKASCASVAFRMVVAVLPVRYTSEL